LRDKGPCRFEEKDYRELIDAYETIEEGNPLYPKAVIDEYFTIDEIELLKGFLKKHYDTDLAFVIKVELPISRWLS
jgi:hypothetical protein